MYDFSKGYYKIYVHNDVGLIRKLRNHQNPILSEAFKRGYSYSDEERDERIPFYIRIEHGEYQGRNSYEFHAYDTSDMITVNGRDLVSFVPDDLFEM